MRLFIAVKLSDEIKKNIMSSLHDMKKAGVRGSYVPLQNLHLTLAFIGETKDAAAVRDAMSHVSFREFRLTLSDMGTFGDLLWVGMKGNQGLSGVARSVRECLDEAGIGYDRKKFSPHITVIRRMAGNWKKIPAPKGEMTVGSISLMKSEQKDGRRVYTEIFSVQAGA